MDDGQLLHEYVTTGSQQAFGELVKRHLNLVYAAARRQVRDAHLADDVAQAVFIIFARKAKAVRSAAVLPAWLLSTTRFAASNALSLENRRRRHEQKAAEMAPIAHEPPDPIPDDDLTPTLDEALHRLDENDRSAVAMRFFQGRSLRDVGVAMGISEEAAQKRVTRAVDKLRQFFARRGVTMPSQAMLDGLARQSAAVAPAGLAAIITTGALSSASSAAAVTTNAAFIAKGATSAITMAKMQLAAVVIGAALAITTAGVVVTKNHSAAPARSAAPASPVPASATSPMWTPRQVDWVAGTQSVRFRNMLMVPTLVSNTEQYTIGVDDSVRRTGDEPAGLVASTQPNPQGLGSRGWQVLAMPYLNKRVRLTAFLKTENVQAMAGVQLVVLGANWRIQALDVTGVPIVRGSTDWTRVQAVADVPADAVQIQFAGALWGSGKLWMDGFELDVVPDSVPTTVDSKWHGFTMYTGAYEFASDPTTPRDGHATVRIRSTGALGGQWASYCRKFHGDDLDPYRGRKLRITAFIKSDKVIQRAGLYAHATNLTEVVAMDNQQGRRAVVGSLNWLKYAAVLSVPQDAETVEVGVRLAGPGTVWVDNFQIELIDESTAKK